MVTLNQAKQIRTEQDSGGILGGAIDVAMNFNTGLARTLGIPRAITDFNEQVGGAIFGNIGKRTGDPGFNLLPTSEQIQRAGSKAGITFAPGEEPDTLGARTIQNIGAAAPILPFFGLSVPVLITEVVASFGGAAGGKALQATEFGKRHPELARAIGELGGGLGGAFSIPLARFLVKGGSIRHVYNLIKKLIPGTEKRVTQRLKDIELTPETALRELEAMEKIPEGKFLLPGQATGTTGIARLTKTVEEEIPKVAAIIEKRRITAISQLQKQFTKSGDIGDARALLEEKLALHADQAAKAMSKINKVSDPTVLSTNAERILAKAEAEGRKVLDDVWRNQPSGTRGTGNNLNSVIWEELENITEGGSINQISVIARQKLGTLKFNKELDDFELAGGSLFNPKKPEADAKAIHQFYSLLGSEKARLGRIGGQANKIRIINRLREAALADLDDVAVGGNYKNAIKLTREFHDKFTKGTVGRILGRARGETPSPVTALEDIVGAGGVQAKENIQQALRAAPQVKKQIEDFLKTQFAIVAKNETNNRINATAGNVFIKKFGSILDDIFPELKRDLQDAIARQADVDKFIGVPQVSGLSPLLKERTAAGFFLGKDPGEEMAALLRNKTIQRTNFLSDLVKITKTDSTGKALKGLQNGFTDELLKHGNVGEISKLSGVKMIKKLVELEKTTLKSGLFSKDEFNRLKRIAEVFKKIEFELGAKPLKGGIIHDPLSMLIALPGRFIGARLGGRAGQDMGSGLVLASAGAKTVTNVLKGLTNDEARKVLIRFVLDKKLAKDLLTDVTKLSSTQRGTLLGRILDKFEEIGIKTIKDIRANVPRVPITAVAPAAGSVSKSISGNVEEEQRVERFRALIRQR